MKTLTFQPDEYMKWIYDYKHPDYNSERAKYLRAARDAMLKNAPRYMVEEARINDFMGTTAAITTKEKDVVCR